MAFEPNPIIAIIGLGYVGLPLAVEFGKQMRVIGYDINAKRVGELQQGIDSTLEIDKSEMAQASSLRFTTKLADLEPAQLYIVTVPTPVDQHHRPNLDPLKSASKMVSQATSRHDVTGVSVWPGSDW